MNDVMSTPIRRLIERIDSRKAVIGIVGLGYVGVPLAARFVDEGFSVIGIDTDRGKVSALESGQSYIRHISEATVQRMVEKGFSATSDFSVSGEMDAIIICVPTPLTKNREPDLSHIRSTLESLIQHMRVGQVISLESTSYPGTTEDEIVVRVQSRGFEIGQDLCVLYSPEREDPGRKDFTTKTTPKVFSGHTASCRTVGRTLYGAIVDDVVMVGSLRAAELTKLLENIHRAVNIGLVNEFKIVCDRMGVNVHEIISAAATKPFGFVPYRPGPGLGGHCIPIDPFYLTWKAREYGVNTRLIELAGEVNRSMPQFVVQKVQDSLNRVGKPVANARICVVGLAYKKNIDDWRESPAIEIINLLQELRANISVIDPYISNLRGIVGDRATVGALDPEYIRKQDCIVLVTDHDDLPYEMFMEHSSLLIDTRGRFPAGDSRVVTA